MSDRALPIWSLLVLVGLGGGCAAGPAGASAPAETARVWYAERLAAAPRGTGPYERTAEDARWLLGEDESADALLAAPDFAEGAAMLQRWEAATAEAAWLAQRRANQNRAPAACPPSNQIRQELRRLNRGRPLRDHRGD